MASVKKSSFNIKKFSILASRFEAILLSDKTDVLPEIPVEIDYDIYFDNNNIFRILMQLHGNKDAALPGYSFSIVAEGVYDFTEEFEREKKDEFLSLSGIPLMINSIRAYILNISSYSVFGQYTLPMVDVQHLLDSKKLEIR